VNGEFAEEPFELRTDFYRSPRIERNASRRRCGVRCWITLLAMR
jgi:hypothetical protein